MPGEEKGKRHGSRRLKFFLYCLEASLVAQTVKNLPAMSKIPGFDPWVGKIPWRRKWQPLQYSCLENSMGGGAWWATVHGAGMQCLPATEGTREECPVSQLTHQAS